MLRRGTRNLDRILNGIACRKAVRNGQNSRFQSFQSLAKNGPVSRPFSTGTKIDNAKTDPNPDPISTKVPPKAQISAKVEETASGELESNTFKAETQEILNIVSRSIYTNKEIFIRELISNASDATEQMRYALQKTQSAEAGDTEMKISIFTDEKNNRIIIQDSGIGMAKKDLVENLGTIAKSGSKSFMQKLKGHSDSAASIIGQFGVGFYSSFMVSKKVEVFTKKAADSAFYWTSDGTGKYSVSKAKKVSQGTKIIINLDKDCSEFANAYNVEKIIKRYSNFVKFPIYLNDKKINLQGALWMENPRSVSKEKYSEFFKYLTSAYENPLIHMHFEKEFPLSLHALMYIPKHHSEKYGNARMKPGVDLFSRKVLIQKESRQILPDWLRFVKGVVDSEDLSLNISRESTQNSSTLTKIKAILVNSFLSNLKQTAKNEPKLYRRFYEEYGHFLKEGACTDAASKDQIAHLLRFDSSALGEPEVAGAFNDRTTLEAYVAGMKSDQKKIYYLVTSNGMAALRSPYYESLKRAGCEVLFLYSPVDEFVMQALRRYKDRPLVSIESDDINDSDFKVDGQPKSEFHLSEAQTADVCEWLAKSLGKRVRKVVPTSRLDSSPAIVTGHENASVQTMMRLSGAGSAEAMQGAPLTLEVNPGHAVLRGLFYTMAEDKALADKVAAQLFENSQVEAGLLRDPRGMLARMNELMALAMDVEGVELELGERMKQEEKQGEKKEEKKGEKKGGK